MYWYAPIPMNGPIVRFGRSPFWSSKSRTSRWITTRGEKASLEAGAGIPEYCVVNLVERVLVVFREPGQGSYPVRSTLDERARLAATVWPELSFDVSAFFPPEGQAPPDTNHLS